ncbi:MAG: putative dehydrogenase, partial [Hyphomicrobiaceae bacterium]
MAECQLAIVGCGGIADAYAKALQRMPNARLSAVVDPDASARARIAGDDGSITQHTDIESLPDVDAVL